jgi:competence protein ComEC
MGWHENCGDTDMSELIANFIDVGQGDCTLIELPDGRCMVVDIFRCADRGIDVFKLLDAKLPDGGADGKKKLDFLVITHAHDDHITGLKELYERYDVEWLWVPQYETRPTSDSHFDEYKTIVDGHPEDKIKRPKGSRTPLNEKDEEYNLGEGVTVRVFSPPGYINIDEKLDEDTARQKVHEECLVLHLDYNEGGILLTGDSDLKCWQRIEGYYDEDEEGKVFDAEVLHASHHGSYTFVKMSKDDEPWLDALEAINPDWVIVSVGKPNRFNHPDAGVMTIYEDQVGADRVLQTCQVGSVVATVSETGEVDVTVADDSWEDDYAWDDDDSDDDDGGDDDNNGGGSSGGGSSSASAGTRKSRTRLDNSAAA